MQVKTHIPFLATVVSSGEIIEALDAREALFDGAGVKEPGYMAHATRISAVTACP